MDEKEVKTIPVRILGKAGTTVLVCYVVDGAERRGYIPAVKVKDGSVDEKVLKLAAPYGLPWSELATFNATPEKLEKELHNAGIWTLADLIKDTQAAIGAIQAAYYQDYAALKLAAKNYHGGDS